MIDLLKVIGFEWVGANTMFVAFLHGPTAMAA
jgi:hypothetical protein